MLIVADHASVESNTGKLNILGAFRQITAKKFPARHGTMSIVVKLGGELGDNHEQRTLTVTLTDADGNDLISISGPFSFPHAPAGVQPEFNAVLELRNIVFPHPGSYQVNVTVDGEWIDYMGIELAQLPSQQE